jgi:hypothetical protein
MKPSNSSKFTTGEGSILIELRSKGAPITAEARERARRRARVSRNETTPIASPQCPRVDEAKAPDDME